MSGFTVALYTAWHAQSSEGENIKRPVIPELDLVALLLTFARRSLLQPQGPFQGMHCQPYAMPSKILAFKSSLSIPTDFGSEIPV